MPPGNPLIKPVALTKPKANVIAPQNVGTPSAYHPPSAYTGNAFGNLGIEGSSYATSQAPAAPAAPAAAATAPAPAAPIDFESQALIDPEYLQGKALLDSRHSMNVKTLYDALQRNQQSSQDSFNSHGGLFSGAAANAQGSLQAAYDNPVNGSLTQELVNHMTNTNNLKWGVFNRLKQQVADAGLS